MAVLSSHGSAAAARQSFQAKPLRGDAVDYAALMAILKSQSTHTDCGKFAFEDSNGEIRYALRQPLRIWWEGSRRWYYGHVVGCNMGYRYSWYVCYSDGICSWEDLQHVVPGTTRPPDGAGPRPRFEWCDYDDEKHCKPLMPGKPHKPWRNPAVAGRRAAPVRDARRPRVDAPPPNGTSRLRASPRAVRRAAAAGRRRRRVVDARVVRAGARWRWRRAAQPGRGGAGAVRAGRAARPRDGRLLRAAGPVPRLIFCGAPPLVPHDLQKTLLRGRDSAAFLLVLLPDCPFPLSPVRESAFFGSSLASHPELF